MCFIVSHKDVYKYDVYEDEMDGEMVGLKGELG